MPTAATRAARTARPAIHVQAKPATTTVAPQGAGKSATGDVRPAPQPAGKTAPAKSATTAKPKEKAAPKGIPFEVVRGPKVLIKDTAAGVIMARTMVGTQKASAVRIFTGKDVTELTVGTKIDTHLKKTGADCGCWTVIAVVVGGEIKSGKADGTSFAQNHFTD
jgi:hypothetical protein